MSCLGAACAWLAIAIVCGPIRVTLSTAEPAKGCCEQSAASKPACPGDACALTCATVLMVNFSAAAFDVAPRLETTRLPTVEWRAEVLREPPPVPPPRAGRV